VGTLEALDGGKPQSTADFELAFVDNDRQVRQSLTDAAGVRFEVPGELVARDPSERRWQRIPPFLHLRALKPAH